MDFLTIAVIFLIILAIFLLGFRNEAVSRNKKINELIASYGKENTRKFSATELENAKVYSRYHNSSCNIDDITWNDLDMWLVYKKINYCLTDSGDEYLYYLLKNPRQSIDDLEDFENAVSLVMNDSSVREKLIRGLWSIGKCLKTDIYEAFSNYEKINSRGDWFIIAGYICGAVLLNFSVLAGVLILVLTAIIAILTYFGKKRFISRYCSCVEYILRLMNGAEELIDSKVEELELIHQLEADVSKLKRLRNITWLITSGTNGNPFNIFFDYIRMLTHLDLIFYNRIMDSVCANKKHVEDIITIIGMIDVYLSVAFFRSGLEDYCIPEFDFSANGIKAKAIYHPLIKNPVKNDFDETACVLLTGSNASGKSTFLKTVAINALLAQSLNTVCGRSYIAPMFRIYTALRLKDSIVSGESYYMAEIDAIKRILDNTEDSNNRVLAFVDEILKGTNTTERIAAGASILKFMSDAGIYVMAATHDLELATILDGIFTNYHFREQMSDKDVSFTYLIYPGVAKSRNAIKLLEMVGYDTRISEYAKQLAGKHEREGIWRL